MIYPYSFYSLRTPASFAYDFERKFLEDFERDKLGLKVHLSFYYYSLSCCILYNLSALFCLYLKAYSYSYSDTCYAVLLG